MHIFLSGEPGVGKSTIIKKTLSDLHIQPGGFITISDNYTREGISDVYIQAADTNEAILSPENRIGRRYGNGLWASFPEIFDTIGIDLLNKVDHSLILMDELGFMENNAISFQNKVLEKLDQKVPVLGVLKPKRLPFLEKVRNHPQVTILEISTENRNDQLKTLLRLLKAYQ